MTRLRLAALALFLTTPLSAADLPRFELQPNDHICIIGNALAERMNHDGWLEAYLHAYFPKHRLVIRNLGYSGDEVPGYTDKPDPHKRLRSMDYGTADQWLSASAPIPQPKKLTRHDHVRQNRFELIDTKADVIFAFFGYNESFAGEAGLPKFKSDLEAFIKHVRSQKYNGKSPPRLVLFSPLVQPDLHNSHLPDGKEQTPRLKLYSAAMAAAAKSNGVTFIDLLEEMEQFPRNAHSSARRRGVVN